MWTLGNMSTFNKTMTYIYETSINVIRIFDIFQMTEVDARKKRERGNYITHVLIERIMSLFAPCRTCFATLISVLAFFHADCMAGHGAHSNVLWRVIKCPALITIS